MRRVLEKVRDPQHDRSAEEPAAAAAHSDRLAQTSAVVFLSQDVSEQPAQVRSSRGVRGDVRKLMFKLSPVPP
jgi:hypothetical protein